MKFEEVLPYWKNDHRILVPEEESENSPIKYFVAGSSAMQLNLSRTKLFSNDWEVQIDDVWVKRIEVSETNRLLEPYKT